MGRTLENKQKIVAELKEILSENQMALVINYQGLSVAELTDLRNRIRPNGATCKVTKNTLMQIAINEDEAWKPLSEFLSGSSAFVLIKEDFGGAIKAYQDFEKATKKTELRGGVLEGRALSTAEVKAIGDLPSKEVLMAQVAGALNALATQIAVGIKEVPTSIARGIQAMSEKDAA
ncbi:50S ribosomal protein L10 [Synechococcales cyanobacterium C]|uniref:Large ribosomal subunit protein uL10 n=1 Tax=Petrachloros mirabilis ULC683 TaxID=2781853 RepID=A0A8K2A7V1_9CYAN|nr:50S ribosomal protein L10 [Petrachloros mirabilis]NCJ06579.1 50S ribosomal protein L10 [Petrachloros mirabilis ULC683]